MFRRLIFFWTHGI